jgi:hypothetical protein
MFMPDSHDATPSLSETEQFDTGSVAWIATLETALTAARRRNIEARKLLELVVGDDLSEAGLTVGDLHARIRAWLDVPVSRKLWCDREMRVPDLAAEIESAARMVCNPPTGDRIGATLEWMDQKKA